MEISELLTIKKSQILKNRQLYLKLQKIKPNGLKFSTVLN